MTLSLTVTEKLGNSRASLFQEIIASGNNSVSILADKIRSTFCVVWNAIILIKTLLCHIIIHFYQLALNLKKSRFSLKENLCGHYFNLNKTNNFIIAYLI